MVQQAPARFPQETVHEPMGPRNATNKRGRNCTEIEESPARFLRFRDHPGAKEYLSEVDDELQPTAPLLNENLSRENRSGLPPVDHAHADSDPLNRFSFCTFVSQQALRSACKRRRLSSSGKKMELAKRLSRAGYNNADEINKLAEEYEAGGRMSEDGAEQCRGREPNFTKHDIARLCHVIVDPRHSVILRKLYNKPENRAELDAGRVDPWSREFVEMFNDPLFQPEPPIAAGGACQETIALIDPKIIKHRCSIMGTRGNGEK